MNDFALKLIKRSLLSSPKTFKVLLADTKLPERTLRYNLKLLKERGVVREVCSFSDLREKLFVLEGFE